MSDSNFNKNTAIELNLGQTGNKKVVKQKGEQNNYFEIDYREKYFNEKEKNFILREENLKLNQKLNSLDNNYVEYRFNMNTSIAFVREFEEKLGKNNIPFTSYFYKIADLPKDNERFSTLSAMRIIVVNWKNINKFIEIWKNLNIKNNSN